MNPRASVVPSQHLDHGTDLVRDTTAMSSERKTERAASIASSSTDTATAEEQVALMKLDPLHSDDDDVSRLRSPDELDIHDETDDRAGLLPRENEKPTEEPKSNFKAACIWMIVNTLATVGIVSTLNQFDAGAALTLYRYSPTRPSSRIPPSSCASLPLRRFISLSLG